MKNLESSSWLDRTLFLVLILIISSGIIAFVYSVAVPVTGEKFTEFYLLGSEGKADNYPEELEIGNVATVTVGVINREQEAISYTLEVRVNGKRTNSLGPFILNQGEKWEDAVSFRLETAGNNQKVEFLLLKPEQSEAYLSLYLLINVFE